MSDGLLLPIYKIDMTLATSGGRQLIATKQLWQIKHLGGQPEKCLLL
jgi:hypothetical protein